MAWRSGGTTGRQVGTTGKWQTLNAKFEDEEGEGRSEDEDDDDSPGPVVKAQ
jgi:hypothetical protein